MALVLLNRGLLEQLPVHAVELEQEIFIKRKCYLAQPDLIKHHERYVIFLVLGPVVDHIHVDDVVLHDNIVALLRRVLRILSDARSSPERALARHTLPRRRFSEKTI